MKTLVRLFLSLPFLICFAANVHAQQPAAQAAGSQSKRVSDYVNPALPRWFQFNGEYRMRLEGITGSGFRDDAKDAYVLSRIRLNTSITPVAWFKLQLQAQDAQVMARNPKPDAPPYENTFDLRQGYVEVGNVEARPLGMRVGRQELAFGEMRLIGHLNWTNTARSFDAVRASYRSKNYRVDAFAASVVNPRDDRFDRSTGGNNIHGVYASFSGAVPKSTIEPYAFWRLARGIRNESGALSRLDFKTIGLRGTGKLSAAADYTVEVAGQTGSLGSDDVSAWAGHWVLGYTVPRMKFTPRLVAEYNYATGDTNPTDGRKETFDQLYPTAHDKIGLSDQVGWKNIHDVRSAIELKPSAKVTLSASYHSWWLASTRDGLYNAAGALVFRAPNGAGRHVGQELDFQTNYILNGQMQIGGGFAHIFPGTFLKNVTQGRSFNFPYLMVTYLF